MFNNHDKYKFRIDYYNYDNIEDYLFKDCSIMYKAYSKIMVIDCDGIISTNESFYTADGKYMKSYGCYDKEMISYMRKIGWRFLFVTADGNGYEITKSRIKDINCELIFVPSDERKEFIRQLKNDYKIVVYIGDSISDIDALLEANYAGTTNNAPMMVKNFCDYISLYNGGYGGLADIIWNLHEGINNDIKEKDL